MRVYIALDDDLLAEVDRRAGPGRRSAFIAELIQRGLDDERRWDDIEASLGGLSDRGHEWDEDPAAWVRRQRHVHPRQHDLHRLPGERKMSPAISRAVTEFLRRQRVREFGRLLREGAFDYPLTNDEIESADS